MRSFAGPIGDEIVVTTVKETGRVTRTRWRLATRLAFRFLFVYAVLYTFPPPPNSLPYVWRVLGWVYSAWHAVVPWVGAHVLHLSYPITVLPNGSGDTTYNYVQVFCVFVLALIGAIIWSILDRRRTQYATLYEWLRIWIRYILGFAMLTYGFAKLRPGQFYYPMPEQLLRPYGELSPFTLLWTFMGFSYSYSIFAALGEIIGGILLFFRRTTVLGALFVIGVMSNVVTLDLFYDVPVKLYSAHLLLMAFFLLAGERKRLFNFFFANRTAGPSTAEFPLRSKLSQRGRVLVKAIVLLNAAYVSSFAARRAIDHERNPMPLPTLAGAYQVEEFKRNGAVIPPLTTDTTRWKRVFISTMGNGGYPGGGSSVELMNDSLRQHGIIADSSTHMIIFTPLLELDSAHMAAWRMFALDSTRQTVFNYRNIGNDTLALAGRLGMDSVDIVLRRIDHTKMLLVRRGFHWINEYVCCYF
jgi:hypothetical protein